MLVMLMLLALVPIAALAAPDTTALEDAITAAEAHIASDRVAGTMTASRAAFEEELAAAKVLLAYIDGGGTATQQDINDAAEVLSEATLREALTRYVYNGFRTFLDNQLGAALLNLLLSPALVGGLIRDALDPEAVLDIAGPLLADLIQDAVADAIGIALPDEIVVTMVSAILENNIITDILNSDFVDEVLDEFVNILFRNIVILDVLDPIIWTLAENVANDLWPVRGTLEAPALALFGSSGPIFTDAGGWQQPQITRVVTGIARIANITSNIDSYLDGLNVNDLLDNIDMNIILDALLEAVTTVAERRVDEWVVMYQDMVDAFIAWVQNIVDDALEIWDEALELLEDMIEIIEFILNDDAFIVVATRGVEADALYAFEIVANETLRDMIDDFLTKFEDSTFGDLTAIRDFATLMERIYNGEELEFIMNLFGGEFTHGWNFNYGAPDFALEDNVLVRGAEYLNRDGHNAKVAYQVVFTFPWLDQWVSDFEIVLTLATAWVNPEWQSVILEGIATGAAADSENRMDYDGSIPAGEDRSLHWPGDLVEINPGERGTEYITNHPTINGTVRAIHTFERWEDPDDLLDDADVAEASFIMPDEDVVLEAIWDTVYYVEVIFDANEGIFTVEGEYEEEDDVSIWIRYVPGGTNWSAALELKSQTGYNDPTKEGWRFLGWGVAADSTQNIEADHMIGLNSQVRYYARWVREWTVTFVLGDGGVYAGSQTLLNQTVTNGENATALTENPTREGYIFDGWEPELNLTNVTENRTFTAKWAEPQPQQWTVTFILGDGGVYAGSQTLLNQTINNGESATALTENPTREGYIFDGWEPELNLTNVTENRTFTAKWVEQQPQQWTVTFVLGDSGVYAGSQTLLNQTINNGDSATALTEDPTREGYIFEGWEPELDLTNVTENRTFTAQWVEQQPQPQRWTVNFVLGSGGAYAGNQALLNQTVNNGGNATALTVAPTREGYIFNGWTPTLNLENVTENRTFTAQWLAHHPHAQQWTVRFVLVGGVYGGNQALLTQTVINGENATALTADPTREGYIFNGWTPSLSLTNVTENRTFTAQWLEDYDEPETHTWFMMGRAGGNFVPSGNITRAEVATMLVRTMIPEYDPALPPPAGMPFPDVNSDDWFFGYVAWAYNAGFIEGRPDGRFDPRARISRQEVAAMVARATGVDILPAGEFSSVDADQISNWAQDYVYTVYRQGWMMGNSRNQLAPRRSITRAETAAVFCRVLERGITNATSLERVADDLRLFPDVEYGRWYYYYVIEASHTHEFIMEDGVEIWTSVTVPQS